MRAVLHCTGCFFDLLDEADPASAGSYFYTSPNVNAFKKVKLYRYDISVKFKNIIMHITEYNFNDGALLLATHVYHMFVIQACLELSLLHEVGLCVG